MSDLEKENPEAHIRRSGIDEVTCEEMQRVFADIGLLGARHERLRITEVLGQKADADRLAELVSNANQRYRENIRKPNSSWDFRQKMKEGVFMEITGTNSESMQAQNRSLILKTLMQRKVCTRIDLAKQMNLTQAAISKLVSNMVETGLVLERLSSSGKTGRRTIELFLNNDWCKVLAVKLARKSFAVAVFQLGGSCVTEKSVTIDPTEDSPRTVVDEIKYLMRECCAKYDIKAIGIAVPGPYLHKQGKIALMSEYKGWNEIDIREEFENDFDVPVIIEHDANAGALAEWTYGETDYSTGGGSLISLLVSEGVGAGIINNGSIVKGTDGVAGEVGHMSINADGPRCICGNYGCLELYVSALSFARMVKEDLPEHPESTLNNAGEITADLIFRHMRRGDRFSIDEVKKVGRYLGYGIANMVYLYNPKEIILTDIMTGGGKILLDAAWVVVKERTLPALHKDLSIRITNLDNDAILVGAAALAVNRLLEEPSRLF